MGPTGWLAIPSNHLHYLDLLDLLDLLPLSPEAFLCSRQPPQRSYVDKWKKVQKVQKVQNCKRAGETAAAIAPGDRKIRWIGEMMFEGGDLMNIW